MDAEFRLDRLLALTWGVAPPGGAALQMVLPALCEEVRPAWPLLGGAGLSPAIVGDLGDWLRRAVERAEPWSAQSLDAIFDAAAAAFGCSADAVRVLAGVFVLGAPTPLPLAGVLEVMGREGCAARLDRSTRAFKAMQMIG